MLHMKGALSKVFPDILCYTCPKARNYLSQELPGVMKKKNLKTIELFGLEGTFKDLLDQVPAMNRDIFNWIRFLRALSNLTLSATRDRSSVYFL